jgi:3-hydroxybutyryl-CoA dehydrogenase
MEKPAEIKHAVVIGTGLMGPGIAYTLASAGCQVAIYGRSEESLERGLRSFRKVVGTLTEEACISGEEGPHALNRLVGTLDLEAVVSRADLVTESITEDLEIKQELFQRIERYCPSHTLLTSNTSGLPASQLTTVLKRPARFAVTHFWNPPHLMPLVEVVKGERTAQETIDTLVGILENAGKKPVVVLKDTPGQLGNRLFHALIREAIWIVQEGIASARDVDTAIKTGLGRRFPVYGALEHQDAVGLDMVYAVQSYMCKALCNEIEPPRLLKEKVESGQLGVRSGRGFYDWTQQEIDSLIERRDRFLIELLKSETSL